ncbi:hypothetical protein M0805_009860 [Coniferiporia weirii]|nr:hypothetical protein M0805_009860 [Coniferiporia weirii]
MATHVLGTTSPDNSNQRGGVRTLTDPSSNAKAIASTSLGAGARVASSSSRSLPPSSPPTAPLPPLPTSTQPALPPGAMAPVHVGQHQVRGAASIGSVKDLRGKIGTPYEAEGFSGATHASKPEKVAVHQKRVSSSSQHNTVPPVQASSPKSTGTASSARLPRPILSLRTTVVQSRTVNPPQAAAAAPVSPPPTSPENKNNTTLRPAVSSNNIFMRLSRGLANTRSSPSLRPSDANLTARPVVSRSKLAGIVGSMREGMNEKVAEREKEKERASDRRRAEALRARGLLPASRRYSYAALDSDEGHGPSGAIGPLLRTEGERGDVKEPVSEGGQGGMSAAEVVMQAWKMRNENGAHVAVPSSAESPEENLREGNESQLDEHKENEVEQQTPEHTATVFPKESQDPSSSPVKGGVNSTHPPSSVNLLAPLSESPSISSSSPTITQSGTPTGPQGQLEDPPASPASRSREPPSPSQTKPPISPKLNSPTKPLPSMPPSLDPLHDMAQDVSNGAAQASGDAKAGKAKDSEKAALGAWKFPASPIAATTPLHTQPSLVTLENQGPPTAAHVGIAGEVDEVEGKFSATPSSLVENALQGRQSEQTKDVEDSKDARRPETPEDLPPPSAKSISSSSATTVIGRALRSPLSSPSHPRSSVHSQSSKSPTSPRSSEGAYSRSKEGSVRGPRSPPTPQRRSLRSSNGSVGSRASSSMSASGEAVKASQIDSNAPSDLSSLPGVTERVPVSKITAVESADEAALKVNAWLSHAARTEKKQLEGLRSDVDIPPPPLPPKDVPITVDVSKVEHDRAREDTARDRGDEGAKSLRSPLEASSPTSSAAHFSHNTVPRNADSLVHPSDSNPSVSSSPVQSQVPARSPARRIPACALGLALPALSPTTSTATAGTSISATSTSSGAAFPRTPSESSHDHSPVRVLVAPQEEDEIEEPVEYNVGKEISVKEFGVLAGLGSVEEEDSESFPLTSSLTCPPPHTTFDGQAVVVPIESVEKEKKKSLNLFGRRRNTNVGTPTIAIPQSSAFIKATKDANGNTRETLDKPRNKGSLRNLRHAVTSVTAGLTGTRPRATSPMAHPPFPHQIPNIPSSDAKPSRERVPLRSATMLPSSPRSGIASSAGNLLSPASASFLSPGSQSFGARPRAPPVSPRMHSRGSILIETGAIEDEESRRLSELAFLDF